MSATDEHLRWTEIRALAPAGWHELVAEVLARVAANGVAFGRSSLAGAQPPEGWDFVRTYVPSATDGEDLRARLRRALVELAERSGVHELCNLAVEFRELPPEDYASSWKKSWKPFRLGRLCVLPKWLEHELAPGEIRLTLEPGGAFGSGRHSTTRACLRALQTRLEPGQRVLDAGTGSGILSVCAALFGAASTLGFDNEASSLPYAQNLAESNGVAGACEFRQGGFDVLKATDGPFDAVFANIYWDVITAHAHDLAARLRPGGWFAFSGCPMDHELETERAIARAGLQVREHPVRGRWHSFIGIRPV